MKDKEIIQNLKNFIQKLELENNETEENYLEIAYWLEDLKNITKKTEKALVDYANKKYPIGTTYISLKNNERATIGDKFDYFSRDNGLTDGYGGIVYYEGKWAKILSLPGEDENKTTYTLSLRKLDDGTINLAFDDYYGREKSIGHLNNNGHLHLLNNTNRLDNYNEWIEHGAKIDESIINFQGKEDIGQYQLSRKHYKQNTCLIRIEEYYDEISGTKRLCYDKIFDLTDAKPCENCKDPNIMKTKYSETPVIF